MMIFNDNNGKFSYTPHPTPHTPHPTPEVFVKNLPLSATPYSLLPTPYSLLPTPYSLFPLLMKSQIGDLKQLYETEYDQWLTETVNLLKNRQF
ncbi:hypothetical protein [Moorena sp. SIOASIH]|uniref:hypothetical protein n=1 Tax=Moorena sp. SIOASIH TaxID=2607817 RepID=UPI0025DFF305|nr:hypothetical protein [Moorena sp. SIOASIH]